MRASAYQGMVLLDCIASAEMDILIALKIIGAGTGAIIAAIRLITAIQHAIQAFKDKRIFIVKAAIDGHGKVQVHIMNESIEDIQIHEIQLVQYQYWLQKLALKLTGIYLGDFNYVEWISKPEMPQKLEKNSQKNFNFNLDKNEYKCINHGTFMYLSVRLRLEIAGRTRIIQIKKVSGALT